MLKNADPDPLMVCILSLHSRENIEMYYLFFVFLCGFAKSSQVRQLLDQTICQSGCCQKLHFWRNVYDASFPPVLRNLEFGLKLQVSSREVNLAFVIESIRRVQI